MSARLPCDSSPIQADSPEGLGNLPPSGPDASCDSSARRRRRRRLSCHRPDPGACSNSPSSRPPRTSTSRRRSAGWRARPRRSTASTRRPTSCSGGGRKAFARAARAAQGPSRRDQQVGLVVRALPRRVPAVRERRRQARHDRSRSSASTAPTSARGAELPAPAAAALPVLRGPARVDRALDRGARQLPDHRVLRPPRASTAFIHPGGYRSEAELNADIERYLKP